MIDKYGEAIEWDLQTRCGLDLLDFFRGRHSWRKLEMILSRLPGSSAYVEARVNDPEVAEHLASQPENDRPRPPALSEFGPDVAMLANISDLLAVVVANLEALRNVKPGKPRMAPRPVTGVERARAARARLKHDDLVADVRAAQERWAAARGLPDVRE